MEISTLIGFALGAGLIYWGVTAGNLLFMLNWHGLIVVIGGTMAALFINAPLSYLWRAFVSFLEIFFTRRKTDIKDLINVLVHLSEQAKMKGILSLQLTPREQKIAGGFLARAVQVAKEQNDPAFVRTVLEEELVQIQEKSRESVNLFRTMGVLAPMFGLLGTLLGIIQVLKELSNPSMVGKSMAMAITSAFYGILLANLVCIPVAGKLRLRNLEELREKEIIIEGMSEILKGSIPLMVMRKLFPYSADLNAPGAKPGTQAKN